MRPDIVALLRSSKNAFISGMIGIDPVAVFRWAILRAFFRAMVAFREAGKRHIHRKAGKWQLLVFYHTSSFFYLSTSPQKGVEFLLRDSQGQKSWFCSQSSVIS